MIKMFRLLLVVVFFLPAFGLLADEPEINAEQWLEKMSQAMNTLNYQGTVAFFKNARLDTMRYLHSAHQGLEQERLLSLNSPMREIIRDGGKVSCIFDKSKEIIVNHRPVSKSFIIDLPSDFSALNTVYQYSLGTEESVAMRFARIVFINPLDEFRYPRKIWIDKEYFLPLKVEVYNLAGEVLNQVVFTEIQIVDTLDFVEVGKNLGKENTKHIHLLDTVPIGKTDFNLEHLPAGFQVIFVTRLDVGDSAKNVDHLFLSDGFSSVSVYREAEAEGVKLGLQVLGSVNSFTHVFGNRQITAMGDVPVKTVQVIAQGVTSK